MSKIYYLFFKIIFYLLRYKSIVEINSHYSLNAKKTNIDIVFELLKKKDKIEDYEYYNLGYYKCSARFSKLIENPNQIKNIYKLLLLKQNNLIAMDDFGWCSIGEYYKVIVLIKKDERLKPRLIIHKGSFDNENKELKVNIELKNLKTMLYSLSIIYNKSRKSFPFGVFIYVVFRAMKKRIFD